MEFVNQWGKEVLFLPLPAVDPPPHLLREREGREIASHLSSFWPPPG